MISYLKFTFKFKINVIEKKKTLGGRKKQLKPHTH